MALKSFYSIFFKLGTKILIVSPGVLLLRFTSVVLIEKLLIHLFCSTLFFQIA